MSDGGSHSGFGGGAPRPGPEQVAAARFSILDDADSCAAYGETTVGRLTALHDAADSHAASADPGSISALLKDFRDRAANLDPQALIPKGLFDSRSRRLKAFRETYARVAASAGEAAAALSGHAGHATHRFGALEGLFSEAQDIVTALDAHIAAAGAWLGDHARAAVDHADDAAAEDASAPHPLETRGATLAGHRRQAMASLPRLRALQNADGRTAPALKTAAQAIETWQTEWREALGLAGKKPKSVRPDPSLLTQSRDAMLASVTSTERVLSDSAARRAEISRAA